MTDDAAPDVLDSTEAGGKIVRGGALRVVGFVAGLLTSIVGIALVTRHLGTDVFGRYSAVIALVTIVQLVTDFGMTTLGLREWSQRAPGDRETFLRLLLGLRLAMTVFGVAVACAAAAALGYGQEMIVATLVAGIGVMIGVLGATLTIPMGAALRMGAVTGLDMTRQVATTVLLVSLVAADVSSIVPYAATIIPANLTVVVGALWLQRETLVLRPIFDRQGWIALIRPSLTFALATAVGSIYLYTAMVLTERVASDYESGLFAASFRVWAIVAAVPALIVTTAFPLLSRAARDDRGRLAYATQRLFEGCSVLGGAALVTCVLGAAPIIAVVGGPDFADAAPVLRLHGLALSMTFVVVTWGFSLMAIHRHRPLVLINLAAFAVSVVTVLILARSHGAVGAAWATVLGELTLATGYGVALATADGDLRPRFGRAARLVPAVLLALAAGHWSGLPAIPATLLGLVVYALLALAARAVPDEILEHLPAPLRKVVGHG